MEYIDLSNRNLTTLEGFVFPLTLTFLNLSGNKFVDLTTVPDYITDLIINDNPTLVSLLGCPSHLRSLVASNCGLTSLNYISTEIQRCVVENNSIADIDILADRPNLKSLIINNNLLTSIDKAIYAFEISANNNLIGTVSGDMNVQNMSLKRNPLTSIALVNSKLSILNVTNTDLASINIDSSNRLKIIKEGDPLTDFTTLPSSTYQVTTGPDETGDSYNYDYNKSSYVNVYYISPNLYAMPPIYTTLNTTNEWTKFDLSSYYHDEIDFKVVNGTITYLGYYKKLFAINNHITVTGTDDYIQIIGVKNSSSLPSFDYTNSMIVAGNVSSTQLQLAITTVFNLNTGDTIDFFIRTGSTNSLTIYTLSLLITNVK